VCVCVCVLWQTYANSLNANLWVPLSSCNPRPNCNVCLQLENRLHRFLLHLALFSHSTCISIVTFVFLRKLCVQRYAWSVVLTVMFVGFILVTNVCDSAPPRKPPGRHLAFLASPSGVRGLSDRIALQRFVPWRWVRVRVRDILICLWPSLADDDSPGGCIVLAHSLPWRRVWIRVRNFIKF